MCENRVTEGVVKWIRKNAQKIKYKYVKSNKKIKLSIKLKQFNSKKNGKNEKNY